MIHPTAIIDPSVEIDDNVAIGPYAIIKSDVRIGSGTTIGPYTTIEDHVTIGEDCQIFQYASIGGAPQDLKFHGGNHLFENRKRLHYPGVCYHQ